MTTSKLATFIRNTILVLLGLIWWGLYYLFGKIEVPMWIYKAILAFSCIYLPLLILALISSAKDILREQEKSKQSSKPKVMKVYGSSSSE